jgi:branched-chain amino acid transport system ATP-binding protein
MREHGTGVLLIDHDMSLVLSVCDEVMVLDFGSLIATASPTLIRQDQRVVAAYLGSSGGAHDA